MSLLLLLLLLQTSLPDELEWSPMMDSSLGSSLKISTKLTLDDRATTTTTTKLILITTQSSQAPAGKLSAIKPFTTTLKSLSLAGDGIVELFFLCFFYTGIVFAAVLAVPHALGGGALQPSTAPRSPFFSRAAQPPAP